MVFFNKDLRDSLSHPHVKRSYSADNRNDLKHSTDDDLKHPNSYDCVLRPCDLHGLSCIWSQLLVHIHIF